MLSSSLVLLALLLLSCHALLTHNIAVLLNLPLVLSPPVAGTLLCYAALTGTLVLLNLVLFTFSLALLAGPLVQLCRKFFLL